MVQLDWAKASSVGLAEAVKLRVMWQVALGSMVLVLMAVGVQSLEDSAKLYGVSWLLPIFEVKDWGCWVRLVMVMVRVAAGLVEVTMPKSSSFGEKARGFGAMVVAGRVAVWGVALSAWAVRVPGLVEVL